MFVILPFVIFPAFKRDKRRPRGPLTQSQAILQRLERWRAGEIGELYHEALPAIDEKWVCQVWGRHKEIPIWVLPPDARPC